MDQKNKKTAQEGATVRYLYEKPQTIQGDAEIVAALKGIKESLDYLGEILDDTEKDLDNINRNLIAISTEINYCHD